MTRRRIPPEAEYESLPSDKEDVTNLLIQRFQQMLEEGELLPGAKLPSERELATRFQVARSSLRQALKVLEIIGVVTQKVGDGSYLNPDARTVLTVPMHFLFLLDDTSLDEITGLRLMIEPGLVAHAAEHASEEHLEVMSRAVRQMRSSGGDQVKVVASDLLFHRAIFEASGNRLAMRVFHTIHQAMFSMMMVTSRLVDVEHTLEYHEGIYNAIWNGSAELASTLMTTHLIDAEQLLVRRGKPEDGEAGLKPEVSTSRVGRRRGKSAV